MFSVAVIYMLLNNASGHKTKQKNKGSEVSHSLKTEEKGAP